MVSSKSVLGWLLAFTFVLGAGGMEAAAQTGTIDGSVVDGQTGETNHAGSKSPFFAR